MSWKFNLLLLLWTFGQTTLGQTTLKPEGKPKLKDTVHLLREVFHETFTDVLAINVDANDRYNEGIIESDQKVVLLGENIRGEDVSEFCGNLAEKEWITTEDDRRAVRFKPAKAIPIPVVNLTIHLPVRWFRAPCNKSPTIYLCYEGHHFLKLAPLKPSLSEWAPGENYRVKSFQDKRNEHCRIREILVVMDDGGNDRCLMPSKRRPAKAIFVSKSVTPRVTYNKPCIEGLGIEQPCCLFKFKVNDAKGPLEFHRCFGSVSVESLRSNQIPKPLADLLLKGRMTRRFVAPQSRICREIEFKPMEVVDPDGKVLKMNRLDAVKCAAFF